MKHVIKSASILVLLVAIIAIVPSFGVEVTSTPSRVVMADVPYVQQMHNYCGPAALSMVLQYWGQNVDQTTVGKSVFDKSLQATNGADMILFARGKGLAAYSWNSDPKDLKDKLTAGVPVIVLQDSSLTDKSGHYRVVTGFDDEKKLFFVNDPYEPDTKSMEYDKFLALWDRHGNWALLVCSKDRDIFKQQLDDDNPVVHIDLAYVYYKHNDPQSAQRESTLALKLEPTNYSAKDLLAKSSRALGARSKSEKSK